MQKETKRKIKIVASILIASFLFMLLYAIILNVQGSAKENEKIGEKLQEEISYLDANLLAMLNSLNNISYEPYKISTQQNKESKTDTEQTQEEQASGESGEKESQDTKKQGSEEENSSQSGKSGQSESTQKNSQGKQSKLQDAGILNSDANTINWKTLKQQIEILYASWNTIAIDLHSVNTNQEAILQFNTRMQGAIQAIKNEDKAQSLRSLADVYALLPQYSETALQDRNQTDIYQTKADILNAYALLEQDKWDEMKNSIVKAQERFISRMNQVNENSTKQANIHKIYMTLKEMESVCNLQDRELFLMNYKEIIQLMEMI